MTDSVIDLGEYLRKRDGGPDKHSTFALSGADGEKSRFALPLWRTIYLASGERGGILWDGGDGEGLNSFVVLDLARDPPRTDFSPATIGALSKVDAPEMVVSPKGDVAVFLGDHEGRRWFLAIDAGDESRKMLDRREREDILFLAGECAGLLFLRDFADGVR